MHILWLRLSDCAKKAGGPACFHSLCSSQTIPKTGWMHFCEGPQSTEALNMYIKNAIVTSRLCIICKFTLPATMKG